MPQWLYERLRLETPDIEPDFALRNSARWLAALSIVCNDVGYGLDAVRAFYAGTPRRSPSSTADNKVFEATLMAAHYAAALERMAADNAGRYDFVRSAIVTWYYGLYYAAGAMVAAADGSTQQTHAATGRAWGRQIRATGIAREPFSYGFGTLVLSQCEAELEQMRAGNVFTLNDAPVDVPTARGGCLSYLKGTADRERELFQAEIRRERGFRALNVTDFRTRVARDYRDNRLATRSCNFINQAYRYRGKANYRDAIFLAYGQNRENWITDLLLGLRDTLDCFFVMSCCYSERRVARNAWASFRGDLQRYGLISVPSCLAAGP